MQSAKHHLKHRVIQHTPYNGQEKNYKLFQPVKNCHKRKAETAGRKSFITCFHIGIYFEKVQPPVYPQNLFSSMTVFRPVGTMKYKSQTPLQGSTHRHT